MGAVEILLIAARLALLVAGLIVPGAMIMRALRLPAMFAASFVVSAAVLYVTIVGFSILHVPIFFGTLAGALAVVSMIATGFCLRGRQAVAMPEATGSLAFFGGMGRWTPLYFLFWAILLWRLATQPLNGGDVNFRWSWLAEQMLRTGSLDFYPPQTAADFAHYFWVESIPPGAAGLHAWAYACGSSMRETWASAEVLLQVLALHELMWRLAFAWGGRTAARTALMIAAATPILSWSVIMGQETGLTAIAVCALCFALVRWKQAPGNGWLVLAAGAAVLGASTREYGLVFPVLGLALLRVLRAPRNAWLMFAAIAFPLAAAWPLRVCALTGNPFYSLDAHGLFTINRIFVDWAGSISSASGAIFTTAGGWLSLGRYLLLCAPAAVLCWLPVIAGMVRGRVAAVVCFVAIAPVAMLWFASVPYTGGGLFYSLRVLSPAFAIGAVFGGVTVAGLGFKSSQVSSAVLAIAVFTALPVTLTLPHNPFHLAPHEWPNAGQRYKVGGSALDAELAQHLKTLPDHTRILSECVSLPHSFQREDIAVVPMWSPEVAWLFDASLPPQFVAQQWKNSGLRYVVMTRSPAQLALLSRRAVWVKPFFSVQQVWRSAGYIIFEVHAEPAIKPSIR
ncbi:MAG: Dolichyl-phosphate-mannose-protein mannosyltransferase [Verrucomicrobia bacterium]|nr:Dolichyl-phosphate-mannose-protein mannosyltransferase [Verrucomicrobiota bacterium]